MIRDGVAYRIISDHLGSPRIVINLTDDTVVQVMDYNTFGKVIGDTNPGFQPSVSLGGCMLATWNSSASVPATTIPKPAAGPPKTQ